MAYACINSIGVSPENFIDCPSSAFPAYGWLSPARISFSREYSDEESKIFAGVKPDESDPAEDQGDFEFRLDDPVRMLPADELFSDGKLVPLQLTTVVSATEEAIRSPDGKKSCSMNEVLNVADDSSFSPKAPRCSSRWRELLGLRKSKQESNSKSTLASNAGNTTSLSSSSLTSTGKSIRHFLHRTSKSMSAVSASEASLRLPLLKDSDCESISISSSRMSLSSSSSGHDHDDFPRLSLDSSIPSQSLKHPRLRLVKPRMIQVSIAENPKPLIDHPSAPTTTNRMSRAQQDPESTTSRLSMDSPRMNSSGKIVFQSLERSCSSPSSFNGGSRYKNRGVVERSYSANVRVTPVLNVPVCSLRGSSKSGVLGFGQLFSTQSKKKENNNNGGTNNKPNHHHHCSSRLRKTSS